MPRYDAPIRDMQFILHDVLAIQNYSNLPGFEDATPDLVDAILEESGKFAKEVVEGDIHTELASIYGTDRKSGKGVTYCLIYGGGDMKLGLTAGAAKRNAAAKARPGAMRERGWAC